MTAQQYLLSQAEFCRRAAAQSADPYLAEQLSHLASRFEASAERRDGGESERRRSAVRGVQNSFARSYSISL